MIGYVGPIETLTLKNAYFRQVLFTGKHTQLVVMCLQPGEEIGKEMHSNVDQFFRIEQGEAKFVLGEKEEHLLRDGDAIMIPGGTNHNVLNTSKTTQLRLYTIYSPSNHPDGTVHKTKAEAESAEATANMEQTTATIMQTFFPITRFHDFHRDANINYQLNRFLISGLEDVFAELGRQIENFDDWKQLFLAKASSFESEGETDWAMGLYRAAEFFMSPGDPDKTIAYEKFVSLSYQAKERRNLERIAVPYGSVHLHGLRLTPAGPGKGTILIHGGFDSFIEEFYSLGAAMCESGYEVVMFDGPGQGSTLVREKLPMTHEWEKPVAAVLDYLGADNVTLIGMSLGGYLAVRAAAFEPRVQRVIAYDVMLDFFACVTSRRGKVAESLIRGLVKLKWSLILNAIVRVMMKRDLYSRWGIAQGMHVMGCKTPYEFFLKLREYNGYTVSGRVTDDVLIMAGAKDHFVPLAQFFEQLKLLTGARSITGRIFTSKEQAQSHCQVGNFGLAAGHMLGWIEDHS